MWIQGYNRHDIVQGINKLVQISKQILKERRIELFMEIGKFKMRIIEGETTLLQLYGLIATLCKKITKNHNS